MRALFMTALAATLVAGAGVRAQLTMPAAAPVDGATLFKRQCGTCHTLDAAEPQRQGPTLAGVIGRPAGSVKGFHYSAGFAQAGWTWDADNLDPWLANAPAMVPGTVMIYRQANPEVRRQIIAFLKEQH